MKKRLWHRCFPLNFMKHLRWLPLLILSNLNIYCFPIVNCLQFNRPISVWLKCLYVDYQKASYTCGLLSKMSFFRYENSKIRKVFWYDLTCIYWTEIKFFCEFSVIIKTTTRGVSKTLPGWWNLFANQGKNLIVVIFQGSKYPANIYLLKVNNINTRKKC